MMFVIFKRCSMEVRNHDMMSHAYTLGYFDVSATSLQQLAPRPDASLTIYSALAYCTTDSCTSYLFTIPTSPREPSRKSSHTVIARSHTAHILSKK